MAAPYIKRGALQRLLAALPAACPIRVVTRWRIEEIALGVSDLEIWQDLQERRNCELWLQSALHAKYYRADKSIAFGSANLTNLALGWSDHPNLEILYEIGSDYADRINFERALFASATRVDESLYDNFVDALKAFPPSAPRPPSSGFVEADGQPLPWRPHLRFPQDLYRLYSGDPGEDLSAAAREVGALDLAALDPPLGLGADQFRAWVALALLQNPEFQAIDAFVVTSRRFGEMRRFLSEQGAADGNRAWQTWMRWILHFLPDRLQFHTANYSEIVSRP